MGVTSNVDKPVTTEDTQSPAVTLTGLVTSTNDFYLYRSKCIAQIKKEREEATQEYQRKMARLDQQMEELVQASFDYAEGKGMPRPSSSL